MAAAGSQQLRAQESVPVRRCGTEGRTRPQGQERRNDDGNRDKNEDEDGNGDKDRDRGENGGENRNGDDNGEKGGVERKPGNLRSDSIGGSEDATQGATLTSDQQPQSQDPTPQGDRRNVQRSRAQGQEARERIG